MYNKKTLTSYLLMLVFAMLGVLAFSVLMLAPAQKHPVFADGGSDPLTYTYDSATESYTVTACDTSAVDVIIPATHDGANGEKPVKAIGNNAFKGRTNLTSITISDGVTSIGNSAFEDCNSLKTVIFYPESELTTIGAKAFYNCRYLTLITIPSSVTSIGNSAFQLCYSLNSTILTEGSDLTSIGDYAFTSCHSLALITIPSTVTSIGTSAFYGCGKLVQITNLSDQEMKGLPSNPGQEIRTSTEIPFINILSDFDDNGVQTFTVGEVGETVYLFNIEEDVTDLDLSGYEIDSIYQYASYLRSNLTSITIPSSVTSIGNSAFQQCSSLTTVIFEPESKLETIGDYAFYICSSLTSITIPSSVTSIGGDAFFYCNLGDLVVFEEGSELETIGNGAFHQCQFASITIPNSVVSIGRSAFSNCSSLRLVTFEEGSELETIGQTAFYLCSKLTSITIPSSVTEIGRYAFQQCSSLRVVTFEEGSELETIGEGAFFHCFNLTVNTIPNSVVSIGQYSFSGCYFLKSTFEEGSELETIGAEAFYNCSSLTSITIPSGVTSIGNNVFAECGRLVQITNLSGKTIKGLPSNPGQEIRTSTTVPFENTLTDFDANGVQTFTVGTTKYLISIDRALTELDLSPYDEINAIYQYACYYCRDLVSITLPSGITSIGDRAFYICSSLTSITIPSSVASIGNFAFYNCPELAQIIITNEEPWDIVYSTFMTGPGNMNTSLKLYVPADKLDIYKASWASSIYNEGSAWGQSNYSYEGYLHSYETRTVTVKLEGSSTIIAEFDIFVENTGDDVTPVYILIDGDIYNELLNLQTNLPGYALTGFKYGGEAIDLDETEITFNYSDNIIITALGTANTYSVAFDNNGGTGTMASQSFTYDAAAQALSTNTFTKTGYTFAGWNTQANGGGINYANEEEVSNLTATNEGTVTLYAQWTANTYTVNYNYQGATGGNTETNKQVTYDAAYGTLPTPTKTGYTFDGWFTTTTGGTEVTAVTEVTTASAHTLYAQWTIKKHTITFTSEDGTPVEVTQDYGTEIELPEEPTREGYVFKGWYTDEEFKNEFALGTILEDEITLYAMWEPVPNNFLPIYVTGAVLFVVVIMAVALMVGQASRTRRISIQALEELEKKVKKDKPKK